MCILLSTACVNLQTSPTHTPASPSSDIDLARAAVTQYFDDLHLRNYQAGADAFGGDLQMLIDFNADVDPNKPALLIETACSRQLQCLPLREIVYATQVNPSTFEFRITFSNPDGSLFVLGPCCGATETEMPPVSEFPCNVIKTPDGRFKVMCLPVYVP